MFATTKPDWLHDNLEFLSPLLLEWRLCCNCWVASQLASNYSQFKSARSKASAAVHRARNEWLAGIARQRLPAMVEQCSLLFAPSNNASMAFAQLPALL